MHFSWAEHSKIMIEWVYDVEVPESCVLDSGVEGHDAINKRSR